MRSFRFDALVDVYDRTRTVDPASLSRALDEIERRFPPHRYPKVLDAGTGTGRIALPLSDRGYRLLGIDLSLPMLSRFREDEAAHRSPTAGGLVRADVVRLPLKAGAVHLTLATHLFYFVARWREAARELLRVTSGDGAVLLLHTGTGREVPELHDRYREVARELGYAPRSVGVPGTGVESTEEVLSFYAAEGQRVEAHAGRWTWTERIPFAEALGNLRGRANSFTIPVPDAVHREVMARLEREVVPSRKSVDSGYAVENAVALSIVSRR